MSTFMGSGGVLVLRDFCPGGGGGSAPVLVVLVLVAVPASLCGRRYGPMVAL